jgi:hypothetical protein
MLERRARYQPDGGWTGAIQYRHDHAEPGNHRGVLGNFGRAEELQLRALEIRKKLFGTPSPDVAFSYESLGSLYRKQKSLRQSGALHP